MAASVEEVDELTNMLAAKALPAALKELEELTAFAKVHAIHTSTQPFPSSTATHTCLRLQPPCTSTYT